MNPVKKTLLQVMLIALLLATVSPSFASDKGAGTTAANFLKIGIGARAASMGGAFTALADDGTSLYWNPAGLCQVENTQVLATYNMHFQEINQGYLSLAFPMLGGTAGVAFSYVDMGRIEGRDEEGNPTGDFGASDMQVLVGYAGKISPRLMLGVSAEMLQQSIAEAKDSTFSGNFGVLFQVSDVLSSGIAIQNIGLNLGEDPLPLTYRAGLALKLDSLTIAVDAVKAIDADTYFCAGLEWQIADILALRGGYRTGQDNGSGVSYGAGFKVSKLSLDYAYVPYGDLGDTHRVSLGIGL